MSFGFFGCIFYYFLNLLLLLFLRKTKREKIKTTKDKECYLYCISNAKIILYSNHFLFDGLLLFFMNLMKYNTCALQEMTANFAQQLNLFPIQENRKIISM